MDVKYEFLFIKGDWDASLAGWGFFHERHDWLEHSPNVETVAFVLIWLPSRPKVDLGLLIRPFTKQSWMVSYRTVIDDRTVLMTIFREFWSSWELSY